MLFLGGKVPFESYYDTLCFFSLPVVLHFYSMPFLKSRVDCPSCFLDAIILALGGFGGFEAC